MNTGMLVENRIHILKPQLAGRRFLDQKTLRLGDNFRFSAIDRLPQGKSLNATQASKYWDKLSAQIEAQGLVDQEVAVFVHEGELLLLPLASVAALAHQTVATPEQLTVNAA